MINGHKIGFLLSGSYCGKTLAEACAHIKGLGYDCVELPCGMACPRANSAARLKEILGVPAEYGLEISEIVVQQDVVTLDEKERRDRIRYVLECIEAYAGLGVKVLNMFTGPRPWIENPLSIGGDISAGAAWDMVFDAFKSFAGVAEKHGVSLALENVWGMLCNDFFTARYLVDSVASPALGVNYDPSHDIVAGNFDIKWIIKQWGCGRIKHVHLKDAAGVGRKNLFVFPLLGEGFVDWKGFFATLDEIKYGGACSVEFESFNYLANILDGSMEEAARLSIEALKKLAGG